MHIGSTRRLVGRLSPAAPGLGVLILALTMQAVGVPLIDRAGLAVFDLYQRIAPRDYVDTPVRILDIDDETIRRIGQWPWPRDQIAQLTAKLGEAGAAVVAYDIVFSEPDRTAPARLAERMTDAAVRQTLMRLPDPDATLAQSFERQPVVLGYFLTRDKAAPAVPPKAGFAVTGASPDNLPTFTSAIVPLAGLDATATGTGFVSTVGDADGIVRRAPLIAKQGAQLLPSLSLEALRVAQQAGSITVKSSDASGEAGGDGSDVVSVKVGQFEIPTTHAGELWLHYTAPQPTRSVAAWRVLQDAMSPAEREQAFAGRIVFIGTGAIGLRDLVSTPVEDRALGVSVHAQAAEQILSGKFLMRPDWARGVECVALLVVGLALALALPMIGATWGAFAGLFAVGAMFGGSWYAFDRQAFLIDPLWPSASLAAIYAAVTVTTYLREERRRAFIHSAFNRYLSPEMVRRIVADPGNLQLGGEEREMTVMFCDIRSFSRISEGFTPQEIIRFLIAFLTPMCDVLLERKATIDKFIGDAILAFWNAPLDDREQHVNAARGALGMVAALKTLNETMQQQSTEPWPGEVKIGIGLNTGRCCVGNMGATQRLSYSLIGDTVNLASRIEGLTKYYGVSIAIGSTLHCELTEFATIELDRVRVVGRDAPETLYALLGDEALAKDSGFRVYQAAHATLLTAYRARDWVGASALLDEQACAAALYGLDALHALLRNRIDRYRAADPGPDWDGVFQATEK